MIRLLRHDESVLREEDGPVRFDDLASVFRSRTGQVELGSAFLAKGGGQKKRCQCCLNPNSSEIFVYFRAIQGHSGGTLVDQGNVRLPDDIAEYIYDVGNAHDMHSIMQCGLFPGGKVSREIG